MNNSTFVKIHYPINYLLGVLNDDGFSKAAKVVQYLIQTASSHPLHKYIDVSFVLGGPQAAHDVGVRETSQHGYLIVKTFQFVIFLLLSVAGIADLERRGERER